MYAGYEINDKRIKHMHTHTMQARQVRHCQSTGQSVNQPPYWSFGRLVNIMVTFLPFDRFAVLSFVRFVFRFNHPFFQSVGQLVSQSVNQPFGQSVSHSVIRPVSRSVS